MTNEMETKQGEPLLTLEEAKKIIEAEGLYLMQDDDLEHFAMCAAEAYFNYPLFDWWNGRGHCSLKNRKLIWEVNCTFQTASCRF